jgi:arginyl-tRNA synthetase
MTLDEAVATADRLRAERKRIVLANGLRLLGLQAPDRM